MEKHHFLVRGHVQGVGYRVFTKNLADRLGLVGWVRNRQSGDVEIYAEGTAEKLEQFLRDLHRGPHASTVTAIEKIPGSAEEEVPRSFSIWPTL